MQLLIKRMLALSLLFTKFAVIVQKKQTRDWFALVRNPLMKTPWGLIVSVKVHLIETDVSIFETDGQSGPIGGKGSSGNWRILMMCQ